MSEVGMRMTFGGRAKLTCPHSRTVSKVVGSIGLSGVIKKENGHYVSYCPELDIASCGDSEKEAFENLKDALSLYLNTLDSTKQRERVFQERGVKETIENEEVAPECRLTYEKIREIPSASLAGA